MSHFILENDIWHSCYENLIHSLQQFHMLEFPQHLITHFPCKWHFYQLNTNGVLSVPKDTNIMFGLFFSVKNPKQFFSAETSFNVINVERV